MSTNHDSHAILLAVLAAFLYALSTPVAKILLNGIGPSMLAALLYLGAGCGMLLMQQMKPRQSKTADRITRSDLPYVIGMVLLDILAPILLLNGTARTTAANVSLLSNFEIAATALIAAFAFQEKISGRMWAALALITLSSIILSFEGTASISFSSGSLLVLAASVCWGLENNCTRELSARNTYEIVVIKGLGAGTGALIIALLLGEKLPALNYGFTALCLGFTAYGLSIFAYVRAQHGIGAARTSAFYALAPFLSALLSFLFLHEQLSSRYLLGLAVMIPGSLLAVLDTLKQEHADSPQNSERRS
jgi:drug/metabolite transporter (DMT)-like permease